MPFAPVILAAIAMISAAGGWWFTSEHYGKLLAEANTKLETEHRLQAESAAGAALIAMSAQSDNERVKDQLRRENAQDAAAIARLNARLAGVHLDAGAECAAGGGGTDAPGGGGTAVAGTRLVSLQDGGGPVGVQRIDVLDARLHEYAQRVEEALSICRPTHKWTGYVMRKSREAVR